jgi:hypothetical protein
VVVICPRVASVQTCHLPLKAQRAAPTFRYVPVVDPEASVYTSDPRPTRAWMNANILWEPEQLALASPYRVERLTCGRGARTQEREAEAGCAPVAVANATAAKSASTKKVPNTARLWVNPGFRKTPMLRNLKDESGQVSGQVRVPSAVISWHSGRAAALAGHPGSSPALPVGRTGLPPRVGAVAR